MLQSLYSYLHIHEVITWLILSSGHVAEKLNILANKVRLREKKNHSHL